MYSTTFLLLYFREANLTYACANIQSSVGGVPLRTAAVFVLNYQSARKYSLNILYTSIHNIREFLM